MLFGYLGDKSGTANNRITAGMCVQLNDEFQAKEMAC